MSRRDCRYVINQFADVRTVHDETRGPALVAERHSSTGALQPIMPHPRVVFTKVSSCHHRASVFSLDMGRGSQGLSVDPSTMSTSSRLVTLLSVRIRPEMRIL